MSLNGGSVEDLFVGRWLVASGSVENLSVGRWSVVSGWWPVGGW